MSVWQHITLKGDHKAGASLSFSFYCMCCETSLNKTFMQVTFLVRKIPMHEHDELKYKWWSTTQRKTRKINKKLSFSFFSISFFIHFIRQKERTIITIGWPSHITSLCVSDSHFTDYNSPAFVQILFSYSPFLTKINNNVYNL